MPANSLAKLAFIKSRINFRNYGIRSVHYFPTYQTKRNLTTEKGLCEFVPGVEYVIQHSHCQHFMGYIDHHNIDTAKLLSMHIVCSHIHAGSDRPSVHMAICMQFSSYVYHHLVNTYTLLSPYLVYTMSNSTDGKYL